MDAIFHLGVRALLQLRYDGRLLFVTRCVRLFAYGTCGVVLALYLQAQGISDDRIGLLMTCTLVGDALISLLITLTADALGRRRMLLLGCALKLLGAAIFAYVVGPVTDLQYLLLVFGATVGVISPTGNEVGPFMALEQSMLTDQVDNADRTSLFAWYNLAGYVSTAVGALAAGFATTYLVDHEGLTDLDSYRATFALYGALAVALALVTLLLTDGTEAAAWRAAAEARRAQRQARRRDAEQGGGGQGGESVTEPLLAPAQQAVAEAAASSSSPAPAPAASFLGLSAKSRRTVVSLSALFAMDSFGGGLVTGSLIAYYFHERFGVDNTYLGGLLFVANVIAGISSLAAGWVASKIGLVNTMVVTHLPSNVLLALVPAMPTLELATAVLFLRYSISQMDVAPRQSYVSGIVPAHERTATMGITNIVKSLGAALGPGVTGYLALYGRFDWAFYLAGAVKALYDLLLLWSFSAHKAEHEAK